MAFTEGVKSVYDWQPPVVTDIGIGETPDNWPSWLTTWIQPYGWTRIWPRTVDSRVTWYFCNGSHRHRIEVGDRIFLLVNDRIVLAKHPSLRLMRKPDSSPIVIKRLVPRTRYWTDGTGFRWPYEPTDIPNRADLPLWVNHLFSRSFVNRNLMIHVWLDAGGLVHEFRRGDSTLDLTKEHWLVQHSDGYITVMHDDQIHERYHVL